MRKIEELPFMPMTQVGVSNCASCKHLRRSVCKAFPKGIPKKLLYGPYWHIVPVEGQTGNVVWEPRK